jgi:hypothetical protein
LLVPAGTIVALFSMNHDEVAIIARLGQQGSPGGV